MQMQAVNINQPQAIHHRSFMGQPIGILTLSFVEMWERFSYIGMQAILIYYIYYPVAQGGLGMSQTLAASLISIYGALVHLSSVVGGWLADRLWGTKKMVFTGGVLIMLGHIALALPFGASALYTSIALIVMGSGLLKPNNSTIVGELYSPMDSRRDAGFNIFIFLVSIGGLISPWLVPWAANGFGMHMFGSHTNFHAGFALAAIGMFIGILQYAISSRYTLVNIGDQPNNPIKEEEMHSIKIRIGLIITVISLILVALGLVHQLTIGNVINLVTIAAIALPVGYFIVMLRSKKVTNHERINLVTYIPIFFAAVIFWMVEESSSSVLALFAEQRTILHIGNWHFTAANFQFLTPFFVMTLTPLYASLWTKWRNQPSTTKKITIGLVLAGLSYIWMALPTFLSGTTAGKVSPLWLVGSWFLIENAKMFISPIGLSATTKLAPKAFLAQMMSVWYLADAAAQAINAQIVKFYSTANEVPYFLVIGLISVLAAIVFAFFSKKISERLAS